jgi:ribosomal protein S18 acetylase RimI-like enzyme
MSVEKYDRLTTTPLYRFEDDLVVEGPGGGFAAFAMAWWDPVARIGEFEPVGTHPDHQRRGLGKALLSHALRRYTAAGARLVQVYSSADNVASEALYRSVGFEIRSLHRRYRRPAREPGTPVQSAQ